MPLKERIFLFLTLPYFVTFLMGEETCFEEEYQIGTLCCPMCQQANRVFTHCTEISRTTCIPCLKGTYMDHPNGLTECFKCKICDRGKKLTVKGTCTYSRNTVCGCARGLFCTDPKGDDCDLCQRQMVCEPGYYVKKPGTETTDTVCETCPSGTFSAGNMAEKCKPWTRCSDQNMIEVKSGTPSSDSVCEELTRRHNLFLLVSIFPLILVVVASSVLLYARIKKGRSGFPYYFSDCCLKEVELWL